MNGKDLALNAKERVEKLHKEKAIAFLAYMYDEMLKEVRKHEELITWAKEKYYNLDSVPLELLAEKFDKEMNKGSLEKYISKL